jgi:ferredoxin-NADP reductase
MAFRLAKPDGFTFKPGQAIDLVLPALEKAGDLQAARHTFSIVSAPFEPELVIATRMRDSAYKRELKALPALATARIEGPFGSLTLHKNAARGALLVAGGIGITPFVSMARQAAKDRSPQRIVLLYSNRRPEDSAFLGELGDLARRNPNFTLIATMTDMARSAAPWTGLARKMDVAMVRAAAQELADPIAYLAGPPAMVGALKVLLAEAGIDEDDIRSEEFFGY